MHNKPNTLRSTLEVGKNEKTTATMYLNRYEKKRQCPDHENGNMAKSMKADDDEKEVDTCRYCLMLYRC